MQQALQEVETIRALDGPRPPPGPPPQNLLANPPPLEGFDTFWTPFRGAAADAAEGAEDPAEDAGEWYAEGAAEDPAEDAGEWYAEGAAEDAAVTADPSPPQDSSLR